MLEISGFRLVALEPQTRGVVEKKMGFVGGKRGNVPSMLFKMVFSFILSTLLAAAWLLTDAAGGGAMCHAADWYFTPSIGVTGRYDSNIQFSSTNRQSDFTSIAVATGSLYRETEANRLRLDFIITGEKFIDHSDLDTVYTTNKLALDHKWSDVHSTGFIGSFIRDSSLETNLIEAGVRTTRQDRNIYNVGLTEKYSFTDAFTVSASGSGGRTFYDETGTNPDSNQWQASLNPEWVLNEQNSIGATPWYSVQDYANDSKITSAGGLVYWQRKFSETLTFSVGAGYRYTWTEYLTPRFALIGGRLAIVNETVETTDDGFLAVATLDKNWTERFSTSFSAGRDQYSSADARSFERNYLRGTLKYLLSEVTTLALDVNAYYNQETGQGSEEVKYVRVAPGIVRKLTEDISIRLAGSYEHQVTDSAGAETTVDRYRTWIELTYQWPRLFANH